MEISELGGSGVYDFIFRSAGKLITNGFAGAEYSFAGRRMKKSFRELKLATLLLSE